MTNRRPAAGPFWGRVCCFAAALFACGCAGSTNDNADDGVAGDVEIFSWWTSGGEAQALAKVLELLHERYPRASVTNATVEYADKAREQLRDRMAKGLPPDTFQANTGADLLNSWVLTNANDDSESKVENLQEVARTNGWLDTFDPDVLAAASYDGKLRALPVNVHRINSLVIRRDLFKKYDLKAPKNIEELYALCERVKSDQEIRAEAPDKDMACLGLGNKWDWTLSQMTFEMILPAMTSASYYEQFWTGKKSGDSDEILAALEVALHLYCGGTDTSDCLETSYFNKDVDDITWDEGVRKIVDKRAMMAAMGDWAKGFLESEGLKPGVEFDIVPFPGSEDTFVFTSDTFPLPKGAPNRTGALALLKTFASLEAQIEFNRLKGSIPARVISEEELDEFDSVAIATARDFREAHKVLALSGLLANDLMPELAKELKASVQFGSTEIIRNYVRANYDSIKQ